MKLKTNQIYEQKDKKKKHLLSLKNKYFAIIYKGCLNNDTVKKIHKNLFDATINQKPQYRDKYLLGFAMKTANKAKKVQQKGSLALSLALFTLIQTQKLNHKAKKIINHDVQVESEKLKDGALKDLIAESRKQGLWFYLASSHTDCAKDHVKYQGRLYVDANAPADVIEYARSRGLYTMQWVIDAPVWFVTRPNCRHYFVSLSESAVRGKTLKKLRYKYKTHSNIGNKDFQTPAKIALEEYEDRLKLLNALYAEFPNEKLRSEILKTKILIKKWKKLL